MRNKEMIIGCDDIKWDRYVDSLPREKQDIYYTREQCRLGEIAEGGEALLFVYEESDNVGIYPFIKKEIISDALGEVYYDITTPYGYGGPLFQRDDEKFQMRFEQEFLEYCCLEKIIAEFVRFHPLLQNESNFRKNIQVLHNRKTVWLNLEQEIDNIWMHEIASQNRNVIRKCEKNGLTVEESEDYDEFKEIYYETMNRVAAENFYFFDGAYFNYMRSKSSYKLFRVRKSGETLAAAIFMGYGDFWHYHLAGSRQAYLKYSPNNILLWEAIKYANRNGYKRMFFGGGLTDSVEDNLFRFKKRFSSTDADFYIGKRIHNRQVYDILISEWEKKNNRKAWLLQQYRY